MSDTKRVRTASTGLSAEPLNFKGQMSKITFPVCNNLRKLAVAGDEVVEGLGGGCHLQVTAGLTRCKQIYSQMRAL